MLRLTELAAGYDRKAPPVVGPIDLDAAPGEFICILGRNGAGKSTLMRTIAGLQPAMSGEVELDGQAITNMRGANRAQLIAVVLTERTFSPGLRVGDVVMLGRQPFTGWQDALSADDLSICEDALSQAGATDFRGRFFDDLSDGERQRVMIARALAQTPRLMVLDEITAFLDLPGRVEVMSLLRSQARARQFCVLLSSHDLDLSLELADRIWLLDGAGGVLFGTPEELIESGAIGSAFDTPEVAFSPIRRRFELAAR